MDFFVDNFEGIIVVLYCLLLGMTIAFAVSFFTRAVYGKFVDALIKEAADNEVSAKTLSELGLNKNFLLVHALSRRTTLSSLVSCDNHKLKADERHYFILPENQIKAQSLFGTEKFAPLTLLTAILLFVIIVVVYVYFVPKMI